MFGAATVAFSGGADREQVDYLRFRPEDTRTALAGGARC
jgi:hypothetical protein